MPKRGVAFGKRAWVTVGRAGVREGGKGYSSS
jgi:hypothetical protein